MQENVKLLLGIHCHQPVDNFKWVIDDAVKQCYQPFFEVAVAHPGFKFSVHYSGWLLEVIQKEHKELFALMKQASEQGSIEFFSGGYYEPILASIPSQDRIDQIKKLNNFIKKNFNQEPRGLWLTERVWDNSIISDLKKCGIDYVIVDDYHFMTVGFEEQNLRGYYTTEESGEFLHIFPISKQLRYKIPFSPAHESEQCVLGFTGKKGSNAAIIFDDGEKFGNWPGTHQWVYQDGWLENFLQRMRDNPQIEPTLFKDYLAESPSLGTAYLPTVSYYEMSEWSVKGSDAIDLEHLMSLADKEQMSEAGERFIKGGIWKNFLVKYHESNRLQKRILELSSKRKEMKSKRYDDALFRAETNDVLWHGVFGGLYLPNLRDNAYRYIIECENQIHKKLKTPESELLDLYHDGYQQVKLISESAVVVVDGSNGGQIIELDMRESRFNLQNTLTRRKESYHYKMEYHFQCEAQKEAGVCVQEDEAKEGIDTIHSADYSALAEFQHKMRFDSFLKNSLVDHVIDYSFNHETFEWSNYKEYADFAYAPYEVVEQKSGKATLKRNGAIFGDREYPAEITKHLELFKSKLNFRIHVNTECHYQLQYLLEWNLHFADIEKVLFNGVALEHAMAFEPSNRLSIKDPYLGRTFTFKFSREIQTCLFRLDTISQSEGGFDHTNQGVSIGFVIPFQYVAEIDGSLLLGE